MLRLGIDAQSMIGWGPTGVANYAINVTRAIGGVDGDNSYVLPYFWSPRRRRPITPAQPPNFRYRRIPMPMPLVQSLERRHVNLAWDNFVGRLDACLFPGLWVRPLRRGGTVCVIHDLNHVLHPDTLPDVPGAAAAWVSNLRAALPRIAGLLAVSESVRTEIVEHFDVAATDIGIAGPAADRAVFYPRAAEDVDARRRVYGLDRPYVLHTGTLEPRKNIPALIDAFGRLDAARRRDLTLVLAGPAGWGAKTVAARIASATEDGLDVRWLNYVPLSDLAALYTGARVFAYPSRYEGFGMPALEAMACGTPVVVGTAAALREVGGGAALHVDPEDLDAFAAALERVLSDDALRADMVRKGDARVDAFSWDASARVVHDTLLRAAKS